MGRNVCLCVCVSICAIAQDPEQHGLETYGRRAEIAKQRQTFHDKVGNIFFGLFLVCFGFGVNRLVPKDKYICLGKQAYSAK